MNAILNSQPMIDLSASKLVPLHANRLIVLHRAERMACTAMETALVALPASHAQNPGARHLLECEFNLRKRPDPNWTLMSLSLEPGDQEESALIFPDPGGVPLCSLPKELLPTQAALSLENAHLSNQLQLEIERRRNTEDALKASETSLEIARMLTQSGIWRWNIETGEINCCEELIRILDFDPPPHTVTIDEFMERVHCDDRPQVESEIYEVLNAGQSLQQEFRVTLPDGTLRHLRSVGRVELNRAGQLEFFGSIIDVSDQKRSDEALRLAQGELARAARITTMGQFAASIGHEVSQPLAAIVLNADAALCWLRQEPAQLTQVRDALKLILQAGNSAGSVIRSIRGMACKSGPEIAPFVVDDAIREVLLLLRAELQKRKIGVRTQFTLGTRLLNADRAQLQQVMMNLLLNAIDAMSCIEGRTRLLDVRSAIVDTSGTVSFSIEDNGIGIDANSAECLFDPLFSSKSDGMGMGLTICRSIVEAHGGRIWSASRQPNGTSFHVSLPPDGARTGMSGNSKLFNSDNRST